MNKLHLLVSMVLLFVCYSCATYEPQYKPRNLEPIFPKNKQIEKTFYLIGDAGKSPMGGMSKALKAAKILIGEEDTQGDYAIYLGDNIYPDGMALKGAPDRAETENALDGQLKALESFDGITYFIPGNHDWYNDGLPGLAREQEYLIEKTGDATIFQPMNGCPLKSVAVSESIQLIMIDSQWYLEDWDKDPNFNKNCDIKTREKFFIEVGLEVQKHKDKTILFAMHHPMFTNGTHGGYYGLRKHLYPVQKNIPMPILASLVTQIRTQGGVSVQDRYNELYNKLMNRLATITREHDRLVFASGHEHSMHHIEKDGLVQIQTGNGAKESAGTLGEGGEFSYGGYGFAVMNTFTDGSSWVKYYGVSDTGQPDLLFEKELFPANEKYDVTQLSSSFDSEINAAIYTTDTVTSPLFFKTVWGRNYEKSYTTKIKAQVATLDSLFGGVEVLQEDGDTDYRSLKLRDKNGNIYRMRSMAKRALEFQQENTQKARQLFETATEEEEETDFLDIDEESFYTSSHAFAVLALPKLAKAFDIIHSQPKLYYVPKQKRLGRYNEGFGDELYLISLEPNSNTVGQKAFNYPDDIETTDDVLIKLRKSGQILVDEKEYIKQRLFDFLIGNPDREKDRWRWAEYFNKDSLNVYVAIPKNRDDAFVSFEGNILDQAQSIFGKTTQRHAYGPTLSDLNWFNKEGIIIDRALVERTSLLKVDYLVKQIQESITDAVIDEAFLEIPEEVRDESLDIIKQNLKERRDGLGAIATEYFRLVSQLQTIEGTDQRDIIKIERRPKGLTNVQVYRNSERNEHQLVTDRTFNNDFTKELWVYGLDGEDEITVTSTIEDNDTSEKLTFLRIIGGHDNDTYQIQNGKRVKIYDHASKTNTFVEDGGANIRLTDIYNLNTYDYRRKVERNNDYNLAFGYNPDDGVRTTARYVNEKDGFQRNPFSYRHTFIARYFGATQSFEVKYDGEFANFVGNRNISYGVRLTSPNYRVNYFGYGNETINFENEENFEYNRIELQTVAANIGLLRNSPFGSFFKTQLKFEAITLQSENTFTLPSSNQQLLGDTSYFGTLEGNYQYRSFDNRKNPSRAMLFDFLAGVTSNTSLFTRTYGFLHTRLGFYNSLTRNRKWVLKTNVKGAFNFGNTFEFYQGVSLGGSSGLRGYREGRFTGKSSLVGNADIRYSFNEFKIELIPLQIGLYGGADLGRVWTPSGLSEKWHSSYGGGLWINGSGGLTASASVFASSESTRMVFGLAFNF